MVEEDNEKFKEDVESFLYEKDNLFAHRYTRGSGFTAENENIHSKL